MVPWQRHVPWYWVVMLKVTSLGPSLSFRLAYQDAWRHFGFKVTRQISIIEILLETREECAIFTSYICYNPNLNNMETLQSMFLYFVLKHCMLLNNKILSSLLLSVETRGGVTSCRKGQGRGLWSAHAQWAVLRSLGKEPQSSAPWSHLHWSSLPACEWGTQSDSQYPQSTRPHWPTPAVMPNSGIKWWPEYLFVKTPHCHKRTV